MSIYKEQPIQLIQNKNDFLEITSEALNFLLSLKTQKLFIISIYGPCHIQLANKLISKENGFNANNENNNIYIWGKPLELNENYKLLIIDLGGNKLINEKLNNLFLLNILLSTHFIYNTKDDLNDDIVENYLNDINIKNFININKIENLPEFIFVNDKLNDDEIKNKIENTTCYKNFNFITLSNKQKFIQEKNLQNYINSLTESDKYLDGESFFGLIQNLINNINHDEKIDIDLAYENILLNKARNEYNKIFELNKSELYKKIEYPMTVTNIYKTYFELQNNHISSLCKNINLYLTPSQAGEYINELNNSMEKEINNIINQNNNYHETYFIEQFSIFEKNLNNFFEEKIYEKFDLNQFITNYCTKFENNLLNFVNIFLNSENNINKIFANLIIKIYQEFIINKLIKLSEKINESYNSNNNEYEEKINNLKNDLDKITSELNNVNIIIEQKNKEKSEINKNYFELEAKFDKFNRDYKIKLKENENNLSIETEKYSKMENYYLLQLKEKERIINTLENKIEKINKENQSILKENNIKINELNRENNRLINELDRIKELKKNENNLGIGNDKNIHIPSLLKTVNKNFLDFKESVDKLKIENDNTQKYKYLELTKEEIDNKLNNVLNDIKNFCSLQIKSVSDNYEKILKKVKNDFEELNFELSKKNFNLNEQILLKETYEKKCNESNKSIEKLKSITQDKENLINTQKNSFKIYEDRINDLEIKYAEIVYELRMKEDEFESLFMLLPYIFAKKHDKFEQNLNKISKESQENLKMLLKQYKIFK